MEDVTRERPAENAAEPVSGTAAGDPSKKQKTGKRPDALGILFFLCGLVLTGYLIGILAVHPFYMTAGFLKLGTDKAMFFRKFTMLAGAVFLPLALLTLLASVLSLRTLKKKGDDAPEPASARFARHLLRRVSAPEAFAVCYGMVLLVSFLLAENRETALWGETGWYLGFLPKLFCVLVFLAFSRFRVFPDLIPAIVFPVSAAVFGMEILERFGLSFWEFPGANPSKLATIGNINWFCGYLTAVFFAGAALLWSRPAKGETLRSMLLTAYVFLGAVSLMTQGSASGYLSLLVCFCVFCASSAKSAERTARTYELLLFFGIACVLIYGMTLAGRFSYEYTDPISNRLVGTPLAIGTLLVTALLFALALKNRRTARAAEPETAPRFLLGTVTGWVPWLALALAAGFVLLLVINTWQQGWPVGGDDAADSLLYFNDNWGSNRGIIWTVSLSLFGKQDVLHKLFGVGPDCYYQALCAGGAEEILARVNAHFGGARLTNAHNVFLNILVNEGLAGLVCFCGMAGSAIARFLGGWGPLRTAKERRPGTAPGRIALACGMSVLAILANELFSFEQTMTMALLAIALGIGEQAIAREEHAS